MGNPSIPRDDSAVVLRIAQQIFDTFSLRCGGIVNYQKELVIVLMTLHRITHGCSTAFVDAMATAGFVRIEWWGPEDRWKRIVAVERPEKATLEKILVLHRARPLPPTNYFAVPAKLRGPRRPPPAPADLPPRDPLGGSPGPDLGFPRLPPRRLRPHQ